MKVSKLFNPTHCEQALKNWKILSPILSFFNVQTFHCVLVKISRENVLSVVVTLTPISSISPLTLLTYFTTIPTLHTKHVSSWLVKKSVVFISNQPVWPCPMTKVCYKPGRPDKTKGGSVAQLALLRYLPTHFPNSSDLQRPLLGSRQLGIG